MSNIAIRIRDCERWFPHHVGSEARIMHAIDSRWHAGESMRSLAHDYGITMRAVIATLMLFGTLRRQHRALPGAWWATR